MTNWLIRVEYLVIAVAIFLNFLGQLLKLYWRYKLYGRYPAFRGYNSYKTFMKMAWLDSRLKFWIATLYHTLIQRHVFILTASWYIRIMIRTICILQFVTDKLRIGNWDFKYWRIRIFFASLKIADLFSFTSCLLS